MCRKHYQQWWRSQPQNQGKPNKYEKTRYWRNPQEERKRHKEWQKEHPQKYYPYVKKWRHQNTDLWNAQKRRYYQKHAQNAFNSGQPYDDFEDAMILDKTILDHNGKIIKTNVRDRELAQYLGRSLNALQKRRCLLKKQLRKNQA